MELSPESFPPFAFFLERFGFIPSLFLAQTLRPDVIGAEADAVQKMLMPEDDLSRLQKECILLVGSVVNLNSYCVAAHCEMLRRMGLSMEEADQIAVDHRQAELSDADKGLLDFVLKLTARLSGSPGGYRTPSKPRLYGRAGFGSRSGDCAQQIFQ